MSRCNYDEQKSQWSAKVNTQHVPLGQIAEEKLRGKGIKTELGDENEENETVVWKTETQWKVQEDGNPYDWCFRQNQTNRTL